MGGERSNDADDRRADRRQRPGAPPGRCASPLQPQDGKAPFGFWSLPYELQERILIEACASSPLHRRTIVGRSTDCTTTMLRLLQAAKVFQPLVFPLLYRNVRLTRPSALQAFLRTLSLNPSRGQLVQSLHVGPDQELPLDWWPIIPILDSNTGRQERQLLCLNLGGRGTPWCDAPVRRLDVTVLDADPSKAKALDEALTVAMRYFQVAMDDSPIRSLASEVRRDEWCVGMFGLQAVMELYYLELLHCDAKARQTACGKVRKKSRSLANRRRPVYPRLEIALDPLAFPEEDGFDRAVCVISHSQIQQRLTSPGAPTDSFEHPYLFARSNSVWYAHGPNYDVFLGTTNPLLEFSPTRTTAQNSALDGADTEPDPTTVSPEATSSFMTISDCIASARSVFASTVNLRSLSLTGLFGSIIVRKLPPAFARLRSLTLGPSPLGWHAPLVLHHPELNSITRLRVCGPLSPREVMSVSGDCGALQRLSELHWRMMTK